MQILTLGHCSGLLCDYVELVNAFKKQTLSIDLRPDGLNIVLDETCPNVLAHRTNSINSCHPPPQREVTYSAILAHSVPMRRMSIDLCGGTPHGQGRPAARIAHHRGS